MKKFLLIMCLIPSLLACGGNDSKKSDDNNEETATLEVTDDIRADIEATIVKSLKKRAKNPNSVNIESIEIELDTVPYYFCDKVMSKAKDFKKAADTFQYYENKSDLWYEEKYVSALALQSAKDELKSVINSEKTLSDIDPLIAYIACVRSSGENSMGATVSDSKIYIISESDVSKILYVYHIDMEFIFQWMSVKHEETDGDAFVKDRFGNIDVNDGTFVDEFILSFY